VPIGKDPRSSVASKRFPLSKERLARFRFAWLLLSYCCLALWPAGQVVPNEFAKADFGFLRE
jgi:hypothetical protein